MAPSEPGMVLGAQDSSRRYELLTRIAAGGMATVHLGRLRGVANFQRLVAIKRPHRVFTKDPKWREALIREARLAAAIHHPNVVSVLDVEVSGDELSLVLEYVEGVSLSQLLAHGPIPLAEAIQIVTDAARGLHAAHVLCDEAGQPMDLVHRDVTPQNILVGVDGIARLTDFGVAKVQASSVTHTDILKGKAAYMAPEYITERRADARSDVFALGVVCWELFTGERLFRSDNDLETLKRVVEMRRPPPSQVNADLPEAFDAIVLKALERDPQERLPSALALLEALSKAALHCELESSTEALAALVRERAGDELATRRKAMRRATQDAGPPSSSRPVSPTREGLGRSGDEATGSLAPTPPDSGRNRTRRIDPPVAPRARARPQRALGWVVAGSALVSATALAALVALSGGPAQRGTPTRAGSGKTGIPAPPVAPSAPRRVRRRAAPAAPATASAVADAAPPSSAAPRLPPSPKPTSAKPPSTPPQKAIDRASPNPY